MKTAQNPAEFYKEYQKGVDYNRSIGLYETVRRNENFYNDHQWEGVNAPDLEKPVFNFLKTVVNYYVAMIVSDDIAAEVSLKSPAKSGREEKMLRILSAQFEDVIEQVRLKQKQRVMLRDAAVDGDGCLYFYFDPNAPTGQDAAGAVFAENIDNTNVIFSNPSVSDVQKQPYLYLVSRRPAGEVQQEARICGVPEEEIGKIRPDGAGEPAAADGLSGDSLCTVLLRLWKENGRVWCAKSTREALLRAPFDTGCTLYPVAWMSWERVKNSCHGQSAISGKIPNQIMVNKLYAMAMQYVKQLAFPKLIFDRSKISRWNSRIGEAIGVQGNPQEAVAAAFSAGDMSEQVFTLIDQTVTRTKELMGASDAALGNIIPQNTSAILAVQKAASVPLELNRMDFYQFTEDCVRILLDMMRAYYGVRKVCWTDENGGARSGEFDFSVLGDYALKLQVDIGASAYWSELKQVQTLDSLFEKGILTDAALYLENIPDGYVKNRHKLIAALKERAKEQPREAAPGEKTA